MFRVAALLAGSVLVWCCRAANTPDEILLELNRLRASPASYAAKLEARRRYYSGRMLKIPGEVPIQTVEGVTAVAEAIRVLRAHPALPLLEASRSLNSAASDHVQDIGPKGLVTHTGTRGNSPSDRVRRHAAGFSEVAEVISFGPDDPASVVIDLLVDDGVSSRGHRKILLDERLRVVGIACGHHAVYRTMCVMDLADRLSSK